MSSGGTPAPTTGFFNTFFTALVTPTSRTYCIHFSITLTHTHPAPHTGGSVTLASTDPFAAPIVDPNFLSTPFDIAAMRHAVRSIVRFASAPAWSDFLTGPAADFADVDIDDDDSVDAWARAQASTIWHPVGTARMGKCGDAGGDAGAVVNPDLTVQGARGLRIVDASVLVRIYACRRDQTVRC